MKEPEEHFSPYLSTIKLKAVSAEISDFLTFA